MVMPFRAALTAGSASLDSGSEASAE